MPRIPHPVTGQPTIRWLVIACTLLGFVAQLLLLSRALPGEMPRVTIERLTGIDIAPMAGCDDPTMAMDNPPAAIVHAGSHDTAHHDHDGSCPLCPLLHLPAIALAGLPFMPLPPMAWARPSIRPGQPRAPPAITLGTPPSRGPPPAA